MRPLLRFLPRWRARRGQLHVLPAVYSPELDNRRALLVLVPPSYARGNTCYQVIYMHDGQNLFDAATSLAGARGGGEGVDCAMRRGVEPVVVGVPHVRAARIDVFS